MIKHKNSRKYKGLCIICQVPIPKKSVATVTCGNRICQELHQKRRDCQKRVHVVAQTLMEIEKQIELHRMKRLQEYES